MGLDTETKDDSYTWTHFWHHLLCYLTTWDEDLSGVLCSCIHPSHPYAGDVGVWANFFQEAEPFLLGKFFDSAQKTTMLDVQNYFAQLTPPSNYEQKSRISGTLSGIPFFRLINTKIFTSIFGCWLLHKKISFARVKGLQPPRLPGSCAYGWRCLCCSVVIKTLVSIDEVALHQAHCFTLP